MSRAEGMWALVGEVAEFLRLEPGDVRRCIELDGLPVVSVPARQRAVRRIWLPALHRWLAGRGSEGAVGSLEEFLEAWRARDGRAAGVE